MDQKAQNTLTSREKTVLATRMDRKAHNLGMVVAPDPNTLFHDDHDDREDHDEHDEHDEHDDHDDHGDQDETSDQQLTQTS